LDTPIISHVTIRTISRLSENFLNSLGRDLEEMLQLDEAGRFSRYAVMDFEDKYMAVMTAHGLTTKQVAAAFFEYQRGERNLALIAERVALFGEAS